jgi:uncharacterized protein
VIKKSCQFLDLPRLIYQVEHDGSGIGEGQCDCACSASLPILSQAISIREDVAYSLNRADTFIAIPLENGYYTTLGRDSIPVVHNHSAFIIADHFRRPHRLQDVPVAWYNAWGKESVEYALQQMLALGILVPEGYTPPLPVEVSTVLTTWLQVTDRCNLRCTYCYRPNACTDMPLEIGQSAIEAAFRSAAMHGYRAVKLKYAGGEPLLRFSFITRLHHYAQSSAERYRLKVDGVVLSNGTLLTAEVVKTLQALGLRLMISLDGLGEYHNCQRRFADGQGSFNAVAHAIDLALSYDLFPEISITISGCNITGLPDTVALLLERDLSFSLNFYRENDRSASQADLRLEEERIADGMLATYKVIRASMPRHTLLASLVDHANLAAPHLRPCSAGYDYLVFDTHGQVAKCQMDIGHTVTDCDDPDLLAAVRKGSIGLHNPSVDEKEECRDCRWRYWCAGGCPLQAYRVAGRYDARSPYCNIYKTLYPEVVKLEGLRLLEYADEKGGNSKTAFEQR